MAAEAEQGDPHQDGSHGRSGEGALHQQAYA